jgi:hypothetical protein
MGCFPPSSHARERERGTPGIMLLWTIETRTTRPTLGTVYTKQPSAREWLLGSFFTEIPKVRYLVVMRWGGEKNEKHSAAVRIMEAFLGNAGWRGIGEI